MRTCRAVDLHEPRLYLGICSVVTEGIECRADVYARKHQTTAWCPGCHTEHDVAYRRSVLLTALENHMGSSAYVSKIVTGLGVKVSDSTIRMWVARKKLRPHHYGPPRYPGGEPQPQYRVGDVVAVAAGTSDLVYVA